MPGERVEVTVEVADVQRQMWRGLGAVDQHDGATLVGQCGQFLCRIDGAESVGDVREGDDPSASGQQAFEFVASERAGVVDRCNLQDCAGRLAEHLPGHDVGMVLHLRDQDLVARSKLAAPPGLSDEVDRFGGIAGEDDLARVGRSEEPGDFVACYGADLSGRKGIAPYHMQIGSPNDPTIAIAIEYEEKKRKIRCIVQRKTPEELSIRLDDLKSGIIKVGRPIPKEGWIEDWA